MSSYGFESRTPLTERLWASALGAAIFALALPAGASSGNSAALISQTNGASRVKSFAGRLPAAKKRGLSGAGQNLVRQADQLARLKSARRSSAAGNAAARARPTGARAAAGKEAALAQPVSAAALPAADAAALPAAAAATGFAPIGVSDPSKDILYSSLGGFTQSDSSTAWCGDSVVMAYNDYGSTLESQYGIPVRLRAGSSSVGIARSVNQGGSFTDMGFLNPGPVLGDSLIGDPAVTCSDSSIFYVAATFVRLSQSAISVSKSLNGGNSFAAPSLAVGKAADTHFLQKPAMAIDPANSSRLFVVYTDDDLSSETDCAQFGASRKAIELVVSGNGGRGWSAPVTVAESCGDATWVEGAQVAVGPDGDVYVAWESASDQNSRQINVAKSSDLGRTFGSAETVANITPIGARSDLGDMLLQGGFKPGREFPSIAVDRSTAGSRGSVYVAWSDGSLLVNDKLGLGGTYAYSDVMFSRSTDGGSTWSKPVPVNDNVEPQPSNGLGTDQYQPSLAVDQSNGKLGVCFYDRRNDAANFLIDRYCATSDDAGANWVNTRVTPRSFAAVINQDSYVTAKYMGEREGLVGELTGAKSGFIGGFSDNGRGNPDVWAVKF